MLNPVGFLLWGLRPSKTQYAYTKLTNVGVPTFLLSTAGFSLGFVDCLVLSFCAGVNPKLSIILSISLMMPSIQAN